MQVEPSFQAEELENTFWDLVVIGSGTAAIVNCATRRAEDTLPEQTLLVAADPDPWQAYVPHKMGQYPDLLRLPGYEETSLSGVTSDEFVWSNEFASANREEFAALVSSGAIRLCYGKITSPLKRVGDKWMIVVGGDIEFGAAQIDVCTGPGRGRVFSPTDEKKRGAWADTIEHSFDPILYAQLRNNSGDRAFIAERFMRQRSVPKRAVVVGEGPLAACAVEHAFECGARTVTCVGRTSDMVERSFPASERYDHLIRGAGEIRRLADESVTALEKRETFDYTRANAPMTPARDGLTIYLGCVAAVHPDSVAMTEHRGWPLFRLAHGEPPEHIAIPSTSTRMDVLVVSASSEDTSEESGSAAHLVKKLPRWDGSKRLVAIERSGMFAGLMHPSESLRVLGAASRLESVFQTATVDPVLDERYRDWHRSLCGQARMPDELMGIPVAASTIAMANDYYSETDTAKVDNCAQTCAKDVLPRRLREQRRNRAEPFSEQELPPGSNLSARPRPA